MCDGNTGMAMRCVFEEAHAATWRERDISETSNSAPSSIRLKISGMGS